MSLFNFKNPAEPPEGEQMKEIINSNSTEEIQQNKIGEKEIQQAVTVLNKYKQGKANLEKRIIANEQWWKLQHCPCRFLHGAKH